MKKILILSLSVALIVPFFNSCKKGENDPGFSLKSRASRLAGEWTCSSMSIVTEKNNHGNESVLTTTFDGDSLNVTNTFVFSGNTIVESVTNKTSISLTFEKEGNYTKTTATTKKTGSITEVETITQDGFWFWADASEQLDTKNKEGVILQVTKETTVTISDEAGSTQTTSTLILEGINSTNEHFIIDRLAKDELIIKMTGVYVDSGALANDTSDDYSESSIMSATYTK